MKKIGLTKKKSGTMSSWVEIQVQALEHRRKELQHKFDKLAAVNAKARKLMEEGKLDQAATLADELETLSTEYKADKEAFNRRCVELGLA